MIQRPPQSRAIVYADPDSERSVIACMIVAPQCISEVESYLGADDFADPANGKLFQFIVSANAAGKPVGDQKWLVSQIKGIDLGTNGIAYVAKLFNDMPSTHANVVFFAENVLKKATLRQQDELRTRFSNALDRTDADPQAIRKLLESGLAGMIPSRSSEACHISKAMREAIERQDEERKSGKAVGIRFGVPNIDNTIGVIRNGELAIVAARPGCGKTSLAMQAAVANAEDDKRVLVVSLEMHRSEIAMGHACQRAAIDSSVMRSGLATEEDIEELHRVAAADENLPIWIVSPSYQATFQTIAAEARFMKLTTGLNAIVVDYLQLIAADKADRYKSRLDVVTETSRSMKALARELDCPIILLAQLNRDAAEGPPLPSHLRESGAIEADADVILLIDLPEKRGAAPDNSIPAEPGAIPGTIFIPKNRQATGAVDVWFYGTARMFADRVPKGFNVDLANWNG